MIYSLYQAPYRQTVLALFREVFSQSENEAEGQSVEHLVSKLLNTSPKDAVFGCLAQEQRQQENSPSTEAKVVACVFFSRLSMPNGSHAFLLSPLAVATKYQGQGLGQALVCYGLEQLKARMAELVFTYGDPAFYSKTGFKQLKASTLKPPYPLSQPQGWLMQALSPDASIPLNGQCHCVEAFQDPSYW